jgi:Fe2+ transport system protein FeoA
MATDPVVFKNSRKIVFEVAAVRVLSDLMLGESGVLVALELPLGVQNHLMHMGFVTDAEVKAVHRAPAGDPTVYSVDGIEIALRRETARAIQIRTASVVGSEAVSLIQDRGSLLGVANEVSDRDLVEAAAGSAGDRR